MLTNGLGKILLAEADGIERFADCLLVPVRSLGTSPKTLDAVF